MARAKNKLTAVAVKKAANGKLDDGGGLRLYKTDGSGRWVYRYTFAGRRREMGLGSADDLTLAAARKERDRWASVLAEGKDPISERERQMQEAADLMSRSDPTFEEVALMVFEAKKAGLRGEGERGRWFSPLKTHVIPKIGKRRISSLHQSDLADALRPIWKKKHATAIKAYNRTRIVFRQAKLMGLEADPFTVEAAKFMLGEVSNNITHITSTPWKQIPDLYEGLRGRGASRMCLRWMILTATRSESARGARFDEIDGDIWTIPADRMKGAEGKVEDFRVPLPQVAMDLLEEIKGTQCGEFLFPSYRTGYISSTALAKVLNEMGEPGRPHGFRTSFRTWVQDTDAASFDVAETALAHRVGSKVERSYARSDMLEQRRALMDRWGRFVTRSEADVVRLHG
ncbi:tyrosine-type recombinase/integrase [Leisingera daeponensis]|uniref:tyrosine-type recombinase/integrase n=1 Tax=Leisingera daeponensis TaxID=405746 RepID=UPI001C95548F|nr:site-specific integrase [Leisingera daeponensis]MBY6055409.1 integrase arm-type DNA-binding domain-containing protein [Leisingera daeponensis]